MENKSSESQLKQLNLKNSEARLKVLKTFMGDPEILALLPPETMEVNNHVHTTYSFSPYSPTAAVWFARMAGLKAVGSMDHDSIGAARETLAAGKILGTATTVGFELRGKLYRDFYRRPEDEQSRFGKHRLYDRTWSS